jgi:hypothetical protein
MKIVTAGGSFMDIDAYGGCIAYAELLRKQGFDAAAASTAPFNESIPESVRAWGAPLQRDYQASPADTYTLIDISDPDFFESFVVPDRIDEVIDHHSAFEDYWRERIGDKSDIEHIGAACTQVFERWERAGLLDEISPVSAGLLMCGILDNTLNFGAVIAGDRDRHAYTELSRRANLPQDWPARYFMECQNAIVHDVAGVMPSATKVVQYQTFDKPIAVGQLAIWDKQTIHQLRPRFKEALASMQPAWLMNVISLSEKKSYFVSDVPAVQEWLADLLGVHFDGDMAVADRMWLRKEIMKEDITRATSFRQ